MSKARKVSTGKQAADASNKIPPPRMGKGPKPQKVVNSYASRMLKPTRKG